jgi:hypothetical protein
MKKLVVPAIAVAVAAAGLTLSTPAFADGKINCRGGPREGWTDVEKLKAKLVAEGWTIKKAKKVRDCYEVYGKTPEGDNVESFFHPVTLAKVLVLKRGRELFRAPGY